MTYIGTSPQTFRLSMSYTNTAGTGLNMIVCLNGTVIYASYMGTVSSQQSSFITQPITFTNGSYLNIGCSTAYQTIQNPSIDVSQVAGILNSPTLYANPGTIQTKYFQCFANNITAACNTIFAQSNRMDLSNMTAINTNDASSFTKTQYGITCNISGTYLVEFHGAYNQPGVTSSYYLTLNRNYLAATFVK